MDHSKETIPEIDIKKNFSVIREIGKGATGTVFLMREISTNDVFAVKKISKKLLTDKRTNDCFQNEINNLKMLSHKNISMINEKLPLLRDSNFFYIFMEYCNGKNLIDYIKYVKSDYKRNLKEEEIQFLFKQIIDGLIYIKEKNIFHRDLKLENILLHFCDHKNIYKDVDYSKFHITQSILKICDFGFSKKLDSNLHLTVLGTPTYMAPEIIKIKKEGYNEKVDIWSIGCILFHMLFGNNPFYNSSRDETYSLITEGKYKIDKNNIVSVEALEFLNGLLQYDSQMRMDLYNASKSRFLTKEVSLFKKINLIDYCKNQDYLEVDTRVVNIIDKICKENVENLKNDYKLFLNDKYPSIRLISDYLN